MLVSVSISAYNEENYLPAIFESLVHQTYPHKHIECDVNRPNKKFNE